MDSGRAAAVFRDCYMQLLFLYDGFIMLSPSRITLSPAQYRRMVHILFYSATEVKHTVHTALWRAYITHRYIVAPQRKWETSENDVYSAWSSIRHNWVCNREECLSYSRRQVHLIWPDEIQLNSSLWGLLFTNKLASQSQPIIFSFALWTGSTGTLFGWKM